MLLYIVFGSRYLVILTSSALFFFWQKITYQKPVVLHLLLVPTIGTIYGVLGYSGIAATEYLKDLLVFATSTEKE